MASNYTFMNYNTSDLHNRRLHTCLLGSLESLERSLVLIVGRAKFSSSILSAHHLIGAYFLTIESDKCMRLLTRHGMFINGAQYYTRNIIIIIYDTQ